MLFAIDFVNVILLNLYNDYNDNYDYNRFGKPIAAGPTSKSLWDLIISATTHDDIRKSVLDFEPFFQGFDKFYRLLDDLESKRLFVQILAFRIMGHKKVKLPLNTPYYWKTLNELEQYSNPADSIKVDIPDWVLTRMSLNKIGIPIELYLMPMLAMSDFVLKQYEYHSAQVTIKAELGDTVIDAGTCWGDTALYFANEVGHKGKIYGFEFIPKNLEILKKNLSLNAELSSRIHMVEKPLWSQTDKLLYYSDRGPASTLSFNPSEKADGQVMTLTIDDLAKNNPIEKIDFIKLDIEGAELEVLKGSLEVIKKHRPKLAIAVYHNLNDFIDIPEFISSLNLGYKMYLGHSTIHAEETILFCSCKSFDPTPETNDMDTMNNVEASLQGKNDVRSAIFNLLSQKEAAAEEQKKLIASLQERLAESQHRQITLQSTLDIIYRSYSWKIGRLATYPYRILRQIVRKFPRDEQ